MNSTVAYRPVTERWLQTAAVARNRPQQWNNGVMQPISKQQIGKHASTTTELLLETVFSIRSVKNGYKEDNWGNPVN
jgi:hypothetical protein